MYVDTQQALAEIVAALNEEEFIVIDTEFLHEKTYYPQLCLIQLASDNFEVIIDPLASLDLMSLGSIMTNKRITKVFHAGDQDRIILFQLLGVPVTPVFDLQRAVQLLGLSQQMSLVSLVRHFSEVKLTKGESFSDWAQRPLSETQLEYARDDVRYLPDIYRKVKTELEELGRLSWLDEDFLTMENPASYITDEQDYWKKLKGATSLKGHESAIANQVCLWRETLAKHKNLPRKWILGDEHIVEISRRAPETLEDLYKIRGVKGQFNQESADELLLAVARGKDAPQMSWPTKERPAVNDYYLAPKIDFLTALIRLRAREARIAFAFITNHEELVRLASGQRENLPILSGWRRELIGNDILDLLDGKIALSLEADRLKVTLLS